MSTPHRVYLEVKLAATTPFALDLIERCGKVAWDSARSTTEESRDDFIRRLVRLGHTSVLEHATATFLVTGISRACSHQLVRHRIASYTQRSQRYVDEGEAQYVMPPDLSFADGLVFEQAIERAFEVYRYLREMGVKKEDARFVLPNACATEIAITMNFRELRHFFEVRCAEDAQWEIRNMATDMLRIMARKFVPAFEDLPSYRMRR